MTIYGDQIESARRMIEAKGKSVVIRQAVDGESARYSQDDFGVAVFDGYEVEFSAGDVGDAFKVGDVIAFREVEQFLNRGPFVVQGVDAVGKVVVLDQDVVGATEGHYFVDLERDGFRYTTGVAVFLPPQSVTKQQFEQGFKEGTLQISRAQDLLLAAQGLDFDPLPGDGLLFDFKEWSADGDVWNIHGIGAFAPDGTPIFWSGIVTKG